MSSVPDEFFLADLARAKQALEDGLYAPEDYAVVSRACAAAQSLQIGIRAGIVVSSYELQAAFFTALGLPGKPSGASTQMEMPIAQHQQHHQDMEPYQAGGNPAGVQFQQRGPGHQHHRQLGAVRPLDGLDRDHRP
eukprot:g7417.t1